MGFSDSFQKITKTFFLAPQSKSDLKAMTFGNAQSGLTLDPTMGISAMLQNRFKDTPGKTGRYIRLGLGLQSPGAAISGPGGLGSSEGREKIRNFFNGDKGETPPPVTAQPAVGGATATAKSEARRRAREAAAKRFGIKSTISTSALGLTGEGAAVGTKKLIGE